MIRILLSVLVISFILAEGVHTHNFSTESQQVHAYALTHDNSEQEHRLCTSCLLSIYKTHDNRLSGASSSDLGNVIYRPRDLLFFSSLIYQNAATRAPPVV